jgi:hypothetical protein
MPKRRLLLAAMIVLLLSSALAVAPTPGAPVQSQVLVYANRGPHASDLTEVVIDLIRDVRKGGTIDVMVAWFKESRGILAEELLAAEKNGIQVRVLVRQQEDCAWLVENGLNARRLSTLHLKAVVFPDAVLSGSTNWSRNSMEQEWNDMIVIYDPTICDVYYDIFQSAWNSIRTLPDHGE